MRFAHKIVHCPDLSPVRKYHSALVNLIFFNKKKKLFLQNRARECAHPQICFTKLRKKIIDFYGTTFKKHFYFTCEVTTCLERQHRRAGALDRFHCSGFITLIINVCFVYLATRLNLFNCHLQVKC